MWHYIDVVEKGVSPPPLRYKNTTLPHVAAAAAAAAAVAAAVTRWLYVMRLLL